MTQPALIVDGMSVLHSVAGAAAHLRNGYPYSFLIQITSCVKKFKPKGIFVCWEGGFSKRLEAYPEYKKDRPTSSGSVIQQARKTVQSLMKSLGADQIMADGYEADDVGALLANTVDRAVLVSADKDWLQLVRPGISVFQKTRTTGQKREKILITHENFPKVTGFETPKMYLDYHLAMGDKIDGVPGLPGIGETTVTKYLMGMDIGEKMKERLDEFFAGSDEYHRNRALIDLTQIRELPVVMDKGEFDERSVLNLLEELTFASMVNKFPEWIRPYREAQV